MSNRVVQKGQVNLSSTLAPGLLIQESLNSGAINGVPTNLIGGVGASSYGPVNAPTLLGGINDAIFYFGNPVARQYDIGTFVNAAGLQGSQVAFYGVRVTDGTDTPASADLLDTEDPAVTGAILAAKYTGTTGNTFQARITAGSAANTYTLTIARPGFANESYKNIGGSGATFWQNLVNAVNNGIGLQGPSQLCVASLNNFISSVSVLTAGSYATLPTLGTTGNGTGAVFEATMKAVSATAAAAGTGYAPTNTITLTGGTHTINTVLTVATTKLVSVAVNAGGSNYLVGDTITVAGGTFGTAAVLTVATVSSGAITGVTIASGGSYTVNSATFTQGATSGVGTGATFNTGVFGVNTVTVTTAGAYTALPSSPVAQGSTSGSGTGATFTVLWGLLSVAVTDGGAGYDSTSIFSVTGGGGTGGATGTLAIGAAGAPDLTTYTLSGGTDGYNGIDGAIQVGTDGNNRTGMYALRNTNVSLFALIDNYDPTTFTDQVSFAAETACQAILTGPSGQTIDQAISAVTGAGIDSTSFVYLVGDYCSYLDTYNNGTVRLIPQQAYYAGLMGNLSPEEPPLNKQIFGILATQTSAQNRIYSDAQIIQLMETGIDVIAFPTPGGAYFACQTGKAGSTDLSINDVYIQRMGNFLAISLSKSGVLGAYIGQLQTPTTRESARNAIDSFLKNLENDGQIKDGSVELDDANNPQNRVRLGFMQADVSVELFNAIIVFLINLDVGTSSIKSVQRTANT
jgi:hypothetical protein